MACRNVVRSWLAASLAVVAVAATGLLTVRAVPAGAADRQGFEIFVSDAGFNPAVVENVNVGDVLIFTLDHTTDRHTVTWEDTSVCPGTRGAVPCWPELRFDDGHPNCTAGRITLPDRRCMIVQEQGKAVRYHDAFNPANSGEIRVLGQATTTTGPATTTTTQGPSTTTTTAPSTTTTTWRYETTTTTAPTPIHPMLVSDPSSTTSTIFVPNTTGPAGTGAPAATDKDKDKTKDKAKSKAAGTQTPTTASPVTPDTAPGDVTFDPASVLPGPVVVPDPSVGEDPGDIDLESAAVVNLLDRDNSEDHGPVLLAIAALVAVLLIGGTVCWFRRSSRYDPA